jgi:SAM-dependent methyltransferase
MVGSGIDEPMPAHASHLSRHDSTPPQIPSDTPEADREKWLTARTRRIQAALLNVDEDDFASEEQCSDPFAPTGISPSESAQVPISGFIDNRLPSPQAGLEKAAPVPTVVMRGKVGAKGAAHAAAQRSSRKHVYGEIADSDATSILTPLEVADIVGSSAAHDEQWDSGQEYVSDDALVADSDVVDEGGALVALDEGDRTQVIAPCAKPDDKAPASSNNLSSELIRRYGGRYASVGRRPRADLARAERVAQAVRETGSARPQSGAVVPGDAPHPQISNGGAQRIALIAGQGISEEELDSVVNWDERLEGESLLCRRAFISAGARRIVDVGCRSGHRSVLFASWGMEVVAIDSDHALLAKARGLAASKDDEIARAKGDVEFVRGSLGAIAPAMGLEKAEALVCADNALTCVETLSDLRIVLRDLGDALVPNGVAVLAFTNYRRLAYRRAQSEEPLVRDTHDGMHALVNLYDYPNDGQHIDIETISAFKSKDGMWTMHAMHQRRFILTADQMARELVAAGFDVTETFGSFDGHPAASLNDKQVVIVARRRRRRRG